MDSLLNKMVTAVILDEKSDCVLILPFDSVEERDVFWLQLRISGTTCGTNCFKVTSFRALMKVDGPKVELCGYNERKVRSFMERVLKEKKEFRIVTYCNPCSQDNRCPSKMSDVALFQ
jgi:hypothetical protein